MHDNHQPYCDPALSLFEDIQRHGNLRPPNLRQYSSSATRHCGRPRRALVCTSAVCEYGCRTRAPSQPPPVFCFCLSQKMSPLFNCGGESKHLYALFYLHAYKVHAWVQARSSIYSPQHGYLFGPNFDISTKGPSYDRYRTNTAEV